MKGFYKGKNYFEEQPTYFFRFADEYKTIFCSLFLKILMPSTKPGVNFINIL